MTVEFIVLSIILGLAGLYTILASLLNWDFFFENRRARWITALLGRTISRIFYMILGLAIVVFSIVIWFI